MKGCVTVFSLFCLILMSHSCHTTYKTLNGVKSIQFSNYTWIIKESESEPRGPRANLWSADNVCVSRSGNLEMSIRNKQGKWYASEIYLPKSQGYGTYTFSVTSDLYNLDTNAVLGLFLYECDSQEIDIEIAKHIDRMGIHNAAFTIQPLDSSIEASQYLFRINQPGPMRFSIRWSADAVRFEAATESGNIVSSYTVSDQSKIPVASGELARINYFLFHPDQGLEHKRKAKISISDFEFIPEN